MERKYYKAINFDLDTNKLKKYYPRYQQAYSDLLRFFKVNGFLHRQGSGYVTNVGAQYDLMALLVPDDGDDAFSV